MVSAHTSEEQKKSVSGVLCSTSRKHDEVERPKNTKRQRLDADQGRSCFGDPTLVLIVR